MMLFQTNWNPTPRQLRQFGVIMLVMFALFGALLGWLHAGSFTPFWIGIAIGSVFFVSAFAAPPVGLALYKAWMGFAVALGFVVSPIVMGIIYFLILTPIGLALRLAGRDALQRRSRGQASYWKPIHHHTSVRSYERQF